MIDGRDILQGLMQAGLSASAGTALALALTCVLIPVDVSSGQQFGDPADLAGPTDPDVPGQRAGTPRPANAELLADVDSIQPGASFRLGIRIQMKPGWHVYWRNPGDAGMATDVRFDLPEGFQVGPVQWPAPLRFQQPGGIDGFGYESEVILTARVTAPRKFDPGSAVPLRASVDWLACKELCIPGEADVSLSLPVGKARPSSDAKTLERWHQRVPGPARQSPAVAEIATRTSPTGRGRHDVSAVIDWAQPPDEVDWLPAPDAHTMIRDVTVRTVGRRTQIRCQREALPGARPGHSASLHSVVLFRQDDRPLQAIALNIPFTSSRKLESPSADSLSAGKDSSTRRSP